MLVAYLTKSYLEWGKIFLKSYRLTNKTKEKITFNTRDLSPKEINSLKKLYTNLVVNNKKHNIEELSNKYKISQKKIIESKKDCDKGKIGGNHRLWMNITADDDRVNSLLETIKNNPEEKSFIHTDIDMLFRGDVYKEIIAPSHLHDIGLIVRFKQNIRDLNKIKLSPKKEKKDSTIAIGTVAIKNSAPGIDFVEKWVHYINTTPMKNRDNIKWGQHAAYLAYLDCQTLDYDFWRFPISCINASFSDSSEAKVWYFRKKNKNNWLEVAKKELERVKLCQE